MKRPLFKVNQRLVNIWYDNTFIFLYCFGILYTQTVIKYSGADCSLNHGGRKGKGSGHSGGTGREGRTSRHNSTDEGMSPWARVKLSYPGYNTNMCFRFVS